MPDLSSAPARLCLEFVWAVKREFKDLLYHHRRLEERYGGEARKKAADHPQYEFDLYVHELLLRQLRERGLGAAVFSEEEDAGWIRVGGQEEYLIVVDPFDQSATTKRTFRNASTAICVTDSACSFRACAIGDLSTDLVYYADEKASWAGVALPNDNTQDDRVDWVRIRPSLVDRLGDAFIVLPGMKPKRRAFVRESEVTARAGNWLNIDGAVNIGRLAAGYIDAYLDPAVGQPIYEVLFAVIGQKAGAIVTNALGEPFDLATLMRRLQRDRHDRYPIVASCTEQLHQEILALLAEDREAGLLKGA